MTLLRIFDPHECDSRAVPLEWDRAREVVLARARKYQPLGVDWRGPGCERTDHPTPNQPIRCEDCRHPMGDGTWEDPPLATLLGYVETRRRGEAMILAQRDYAPQVHSAHWSPCDPMCEHGGLGRARGELVANAPHYYNLTHDDVDYQALWRPVDVRTLGWPHDLRPKRLAVLCLPCYAVRLAR